MRNIIFLLTCITSLGFSDLNTCFPSTLTSSTTATLVSAGVANEVCVVNSSDSDSHTLKIFNRKTIEELEHAKSLLQLVREAGIRVPESII